MTDQKRCIRCERGIDAGARLCPFCNWDQTDPAPRPDAEPEMPVYVAPREHPIRRYFFSGLGLAALLVLSFTAGRYIHGANPEETAAKTGGSIVSTTAAPEKELPHSGPSANVQLVPVTDTTTPAAEQPVTSAPAPNAAQGVPDEYQRTDATAVSSAEYQQLAARAKAAKKQSMVVDPRAIAGAAYDELSHARRKPVQQQAGDTPDPMTSAARPQPAPPQVPVSDVERTAPEPLDQPLPEVHVSQNVTVRLNLTVGADGRVHEVDLDGAIPGQTARLIAAVQSWRFKPATLNGAPVPASFSTAITFHVDE